MSKHVTLNNKNHEVESPKSILEAILKEGAQKLLQQAIENEVEEYLQMNNGIVRPWDLMGIWIHIERKLVTWAKKKYKKFRKSAKKARAWLRRVAEKEPNLFVHWKMLYPKESV